MSVAQRAGNRHGLKRGSLRRHFFGVDFEKPQPAVVLRRAPSCMVATRMEALTTKVKSPLEGGLNDPRMTAVSLLREIVDVISNSWLVPSKNSTVILGWGLAPASFKI
ncbi:hypothetical protein AYO43_10565 [Nitrospira sp. SCGC AG-212-E16]|nr:hypothetical protein AYO43_10565 [Nitrospira sp. SCGC AG-212-E16]